MGNNAVPFNPKFWESIGSRILFRSDNGTKPIADVQVYPTYNEYHNGTFVGQHTQSATPQGNFFLFPCHLERFRVTEPPCSAVSPSHMHKDAAEML